MVSFQFWYLGWTLSCKCHYHEIAKLKMCILNKCQSWEVLRLICASWINLRVWKINKSCINKCIFKCSSNKLSETRLNCSGPENQTLNCLYTVFTAKDIITNPRVCGTDCRHKLRGLSWIRPYMTHLTPVGKRRQKTNGQTLTKIKINSNSANK